MDGISHKRKERKLMVPNLRGAQTPDSERHDFYRSVKGRRMPV